MSSKDVLTLARSPSPEDVEQLLTLLSSPTEFFTPRILNKIALISSVPSIKQKAQDLYEDQTRNELNSAFALTRFYTPRFDHLRNQRLGQTTSILDQALRNDVKKKRSHSV